MLIWCRFDARFIKYWYGCCISYPNELLDFGQAHTIGIHTQRHCLTNPQNTLSTETNKVHSHKFHLKCPPMDCSAHAKCHSMCCNRHPHPQHKYQIPNHCSNGSSTGSRTTIFISDSITIAVNDSYSIDWQSTTMMRSASFITKAPMIIGQHQMTSSPTISGARGIKMTTPHLALCHV